jgi:spore coat protein A
MIGRRRFIYGTALALAGACRRRSSPAVDSGTDSGVCVSPTASAQGTPPLHPDALTRFVDALPIPPRMKSAGPRPDPQAPGQSLDSYRVAMRETSIAVHRDLPATRLWCYEGTFPGPTFETRSGKPLLVEWVNELPERHFLPIDHNLCGADADRHEVRTVVHVHGARVPPESDGHPEDWYAPGQSAVFRYPNRQDAATLWYHDHAMGIERLNQYAGLLGLFLIRDDAEDALGLPSGPYEVPLVVSDRLFDAKGQLVYPKSDDPKAPWIPELYGDAVLVNGKLFPYLEVEPRAYRFRIVNASNARFYDLSLGEGRTMHQIGSDQGLLPAPVPLSIVTVAPAERADVVVDFSEAAGETLVLRSQTFELVQFRVARSASKAPREKPEASLPRVLRPVARIPAAAATKTRFMTLNEYETPKTLAMLMLLNGVRWHDPVTERPVHGSTEIWELANLTEDSHPIHLHMVRFQILERQPFDSDTYVTHKTLKTTGPPVPPAAQDAGWKDTVRADPGFITRIIVRFDGYKGRYLWHCHILEHAANEMMRPFEVVSA